MAEILAPQQLAVGVRGGASILVHGMRLLLELHTDFVLVKLDLRNGYNAISRAALLRRLHRHPRLAHLVPIIHALMRGETDLLVGGRRLFAGDPSGRGDSSQGTQQGAPPSSGIFCIGIHDELVALDAEVAPFGGAARAVMDDVYVAGPPAIVFPAIQRFMDSLREFADLEVQIGKLACIGGADYDAHECPWRRRLGAPVGGAEVDGEFAAGLLVAGVPLGSDEYVEHVLGEVVGGIESYIDYTVTELRACRHSTWTSLYYSAQSRFDYMLRHVPPVATRPFARRLDAALLAAAESLGYVGVLGDSVTARRFRLPARMRGCGVRRRWSMAPACYAASFVESAAVMVRPDARAAWGAPAVADPRSFFLGLYS